MANDSGNPEILRSAQNPRATAVVTPEEKLSGDMLMLTTGFMMCAAALWLAIYWSMGHQYSTAIPLVFQALSVLTIALWWKIRRLYLFALERGYLDVLLQVSVVAPFVALFRFCDALERRWTDFLAGRPSRESDAVKPSQATIEDLP